MKVLIQPLVTLLILGAFQSKSVAQWSRINNSPGQIQDVFFYNSQIGYATKYNEIYKTTDGGVSWINIPTNFSIAENIGDINFVSPDTGFITIVHSISFAYPTSVYVTYDGGTTWSLLLGPFDNKNIYSYFLSSNNWSFYVAHNWGVSVDTLYQTSDAGNTWTKLDLNRIQYNQHINNLVVYKDSSYQSSPNQFYYKYFYQSMDGGDTWNLLLTDSTEDAAYQDYQFLNANDGFVLLYQYNASDNIDSKIYRTSDGGQTWNSFNLPSNCSPQSMYFVSANIGYIVSVNSTFQRNEIFKTIDGGMTWNVDFFAGSPEYFELRISVLPTLFHKPKSIWEFFGKLYVFGNDMITTDVSTSLHENDLNKEIKIYPNPFSNVTYITTSFPWNNATINIYNSTGKLVQQKRNVFGNKFTLDRGNLPAGTYFVHLSESDKTVFKGKFLMID